MIILTKKSLSKPVCLVDADGVTVNRAVKKVDFTKRSTYLFKYDASDQAGNHAEPQPRFFCMVNQVRVRAGHARPLADTAASQTLARSDREIGGSKMRP